MLSIRTVGFVAGWVPFIAICIAAEAADRPIGEVTAICRDCHGEGGRSSDADIPILAGQAFTVIEDNLLAFSAGERPCTTTAYRHGDTGRPPTSMCEIAANLSEEEMTAVADYFEALEFEPVQQNYDPRRAELGRQVHEQAGCPACHGADGFETTGLACRLAGQWTPYLRKAFAEIRAGRRYAPAVMADAITAFSDEDIENLLHFYAAQKR